MSDVLSRLIERSHGRGNLVRPRVPSVFEGGLEGEPAAESHPAPASAPPLLRAPVDESVPAAAHEAVGSAPEPRAVRPAHADLPGPPERPVHRAREIIERRDSEHQTKTVHELHTVEHVRLPSPPAVEPPAPSRTAEQERMPPEPRIIERIVERAAGEPVHPDTPAQRAVAREAPVVSPRVVPRDVRRVEPDGTATPANDVPSRRDAGVEPTVVRVSIGRIDVRAVQETAPERTPPRRPASHRIDLDEYLRRRRGER